MLWSVDVVLGDAVRLGGFVPVTVLIAALLISRLGVRRLLAPTSGRAGAVPQPG